MVFNNRGSNILDMNKGEDLHNKVILLKLLNFNIAHSSCAQNVRTTCRKCVILKFNVQPCAVYVLS